MTFFSLYLQLKHAFSRQSLALANEISTESYPNKHSYAHSFDIVSLFKKQDDVISFLTFLINELEILYNQNTSSFDFLPPIVHSNKGQAFNIDYNFLISTISKWSEIEMITQHFFITNTTNAFTHKNGIFLVVGIFENYYDLTRLNNKKMDVSKYHKIESKLSFHNIVVMKNGSNIKKYFAVPFSSFRLAKILPEEMYTSLMQMSNKKEFEQIAFGDYQFANLHSSIRSTIGEVYLIS